MTHSRSQDPFAFVIAQNGTLSHGAVSLTSSQMIQWSLSYINKHPNPCPYPSLSSTTNLSISPFLPHKTHQSSQIQYSQARVCRTKIPLVTERRRLNNWDSVACNSNDNTGDKVKRPLQRWEIKRSLFEGSNILCDCHGKKKKLGTSTRSIYPVPYFEITHDGA